MIINLNLKLKHRTLSKDYRPAFVSLIKASLSQNYPETFKKFYESGAKQKTFTFSIALPTPKFEDDKIILGNEQIRMSLSSYSEEDSLIIYNSLFRYSGKEHPLAFGNTMSITSISLDLTPVINDNSIVIKMLSPLVVREHKPDKHDRYYIFDDVEFVKCLRDIVSRQLGHDVKVTLIPLVPKKTVVLCFGTNIRSSLGTYRLEAESDVINALLRGGIGSRRSEGFGHFKIAGR